MKNLIKKLLKKKKVQDEEIRPLKVRTTFPPVELFEKQEKLTNPMQKL